MLFITLLSLYISRQVLAALGAADYGIYNVVAGVVVLLAFVNNAMTNATQRFLSYQMGAGNAENVRKVFQNSLSIHLLLSLIIFILAETVGLWFVHTQLNIPAGRFSAAAFVYQASVATFLVSVMQVPFRAVLIAREHMVAYALVSIAEVVLKLAAVVLLAFVAADSLKVYSIFMIAVAVAVLLLYMLFTVRRFGEVTLKPAMHSDLNREMTRYAGWSIFGSFASVTYQQGINILLNLFFNVVVNASRAITLQLSVALNSLVSSFQTAVNPQIVKSYASGDRRYMFFLIYNSSKFSFFVLWVFALPFITETVAFMEFWLKEVPEYTVVFARLAVVDLLVNALSNPLMIAAHATGNIKRYQLIVGGILLLNLPVSWVFLRLGFEPQVTFVISIALSLMSLAARIVMLRHMIGLMFNRFAKEVLLPVAKVVAISVLFALVMQENGLPGSADKVTAAIVSILVNGALAAVVVLLAGMNRTERKQVVKMVRTARKGKNSA